MRVWHRLRVRCERIHDQLKVLGSWQPVPVQLKILLFAWDTSGLAACKRKLSLSKPTASLSTSQNNISSVGMDLTVPLLSSAPGLQTLACMLYRPCPPRPSCICCAYFDAHHTKGGSIQHSSSDFFFIRSSLPLLRPTSSCATACSCFC